MTPRGTHRLFVVQGRRDRSIRSVLDHWTGTHAGVFARTPHLRAYVQNEPLPEELDRLWTFVCSETWFENRSAERSAYASTYYCDVVAPDEHRFLDRTSVWAGRVLGSDGPATDPSGFRVLGIGTTTPLGPGERVLEIDRPPPAPGRVALLRSWWTPDRAAALHSAQEADGLAFACTAATVCDVVDGGG